MQRERRNRPNNVEIDHSWPKLSTKLCNDTKLCFSYNKKGILCKTRYHSLRFLSVQKVSNSLKPYYRDSASKIVSNSTTNTTHWRLRNVFKQNKCYNSLDTPAALLSVRSRSVLLQVQIHTLKTCSSRVNPLDPSERPHSRLRGATEGCSGTSTSQVLRR